jgi:hypothetical protein
MTPANLEGFKKNVAAPGTAAAQLVKRCQETIDHPEFYTERGGADGDNWPGAALACAFAYKAIGDAKYLTQALLYWKTALNDDQKIGDKLGCTPANATFDWRHQWNGDYPPPPILVTATHDTGYPMRWYGPFLSLVYDWLYDASGVDDALRGQTRTCLTAWIDNYTLRGYLNKDPGHNYHAGYAVGKTLASIAIGTDGGADGHLWTETLHDIFADQLVKTALGGQATASGPAGLMVGGDWGSWQYGPLSVAEYAVMTRALEEHGAAQPEMDAWVNALAVRYAHGVLPRLDDGQFFGNGDFDSEQPYQKLSAVQADAILLGPSSDDAASWALFLKQQKGVGNGGYFWDALGELRQVTAKDYRMQTPPMPLWYLARGAGNMYVRTDWSESAYFGIFMSGLANGDHAHLAASNFVFSRGGDHLIVDSSNYGDYATFETNAVSADASVTPGDYAKTQTPWTVASLPWSRGTSDAVFAARAEFAHAFDFNGTPSDVRYAHREWVFLPEGEVVLIDRVHTSAASRNMYVNFHANTGGTLHLDATGVAVGTVGASSIAIHPVFTSGAKASIVKPPVGGCPESDKGLCSYPCGTCAAARFPVDEYSLTVPGDWAVAIHVIDGLAAADMPAKVGSLNDDDFDPAPKKNAGVIGAAVYRQSKQTYVVASSAKDGAAGAMLTYSVPGASAARHVVYDAPEAMDATSSVTASVDANRCVINVRADAGGGMAGHPLMFQVAPASGGCTVKADTAVPAATPAPGGGIATSGTGGSVNMGGSGNAGGSSNAGGSGNIGGSRNSGAGGTGNAGAAGNAGASGHAGASSGNSSDSGCGCRISRGERRTPTPFSGFAIALALTLALRRRQSRRANRWHRAKLASVIITSVALSACARGGDALGDDARGGAGNTNTGGKTSGGAGGGISRGGDGTSAGRSGSTSAGASGSTSAGASGSTSGGVGGTSGGTGGRVVIAQVEISPKTATVKAGATQAFTTTVTGTDNHAVTFSATAGQITPAGLFTAPTTAGGYAITATSVADPAARAVAIVTVTDGKAVIDPFYTTPYVQVMTPMPDATYFAPATIRIWGHAPTQGGYAARLDFYLGTMLVGSAARSNMQDYYEVTVTGIAAGSYEIYARSDAGLESLHVPINVIDVPTHQGPTRDLTTDLVLSGTDNLEILGTASARALITSSNGSHIRSATGWKGHLTILYADVIGLGKMDDPGINVTAQGTNAIEISSSVFDRCGPLALRADGQAPMILRGNTFQPNMLTPVNSEADYAGSHPSITLSGNSSAQKFFQGNNVGVSFIRFDSSHWLVGGDHDADGNILLGVRAGMEFDNSGDDTLRGNFSYHRYPYAWSQGHNLDFEGSSTATSLVEHNIFRGSSWMIQSMNGDFRYNLLVDNINEAFFRYTAKGTKIHHNVLVNVGYQRQYSPSGGLYFLGDSTGLYNNTMDVGGKRLGWVESTAVRPSSGGRARNNVFTGFAYDNPNDVFAATDKDNPGDWAQADYNCFYNPDTKDLTRYANAAFGAHDCGGSAGSADPKFAQARIIPFPFGDGDIWQRRVTVSQILSFYRGMYTPLADSPLVDSGDPTDDTGGARNTDIGAVGAGNPHPDDQFGTFGK